MESQLTQIVESPDYAVWKHKKSPRLECGRCHELRLSRKCGCTSAFVLMNNIKCINYCYASKLPEMASLPYFFCERKEATSPKLVSSLLEPPTLIAIALSFKIFSHDKVELESELQVIRAPTRRRRREQKVNLVNKVRRRPSLARVQTRDPQSEGERRGTGSPRVIKCTKVPQSDSRALNV